MFICCPPELVKKCREFLEDDFFNAFTDESRLNVFLFLMEKGEMTVNQVSELMNINQSNVSRHLSMLKKSGVAESKRNGRETYYKINYQNIAYRLQSIVNIIKQCCPTEEMEDDYEITGQREREEALQRDPTTGRERLL